MKASSRDWVGGAELDATRTYRYSLWRGVEDQPSRLYIGLNPSSADDKEPDPTVRRWQGFAARDGFRRFDVVNLFAFRSSDPKALTEAADPVGLDNDTHILNLAKKAKEVVICWGIIPRVPRAPIRERCVLDLLGSFPLLCFGQTKEGFPKHPLYLAGDTALQLWRT